MEFKLFNTTVKIDFLIFLIVSILLLFNCYDVLYVILFSTVHELGHLICLLAFKQKIKIVNFSYYGIGIKFDNKLSTGCEIIYLILGPSVNLLLAMLDVKYEINVALALINLLPIYPLDGGRILLAIFNSVFNANISYKFIKAVSLFFLFTLFLYGIIIGNVSIIIICVYSFMYCLNNSYC